MSDAERDTLPPTNGHHANGNGANMDPPPTPENLSALLRGTIMQVEGMRMEMRGLRRQMQLWDHLPSIQLALAGAAGGLVAGAIVAGTLLALLR